ncbi:hypothetical protein FVA95_20160 [Pseudonocardia sp. EV170527-09]|uniref:hypothetical protein n=1 Tax=Pseudonocardia sp. EV170527-09 TaxID=2603411 RepID=UPI001255A7B1|nr:hypothetical protein [Pseudonocardia sp. EV170527-09]KAA1021466.1 hypothetical protein FVA95_20160 [Pseudonocardia sp. EV170527-09]
MTAGRAPSTTDNIAGTTVLVTDPIAPWLGWLVNLVVAEWLVARRGLPGVRWSTFRQDPDPASRATG